MAEKETMIKIDNVSKVYKLGEIGGTTLVETFQRLKAKILRREDPTKKIGAKNYNKGEKFKALDDINLTIKKGERVGIIGHNGAGKSTLLKLICRVTAPTSGEIGLNGRLTSMLEVGTGFHPELTGRENIYMNGAILGMTKKEIDAVIEDIIDFSEVREFIDTPVKRYSSGMYVKLAFSVAAHLRSEIVIMDEVLAVGDVDFQNKCISKMMKVSFDESRTILYVSHNMSTIKKLCNRVIVLNHGRIIYDGSVGKGIKKYISFNLEMANTFDLSKSRSRLLPDKVDGKFLRLKFLNKELPVYSFKEDIKFEVEYSLNRASSAVYIRLEVKNDEGFPLGITFCRLGIGLLPGIYISNVTWSKVPLIPGNYFATLVLYEVDDNFYSNDLDYVYPDFSFSIKDDSNLVKIQWNSNTWGDSLFEPLSSDTYKSDDCR